MNDVIAAPAVGQKRSLMFAFKLATLSAETIIYAVHVMSEPVEVLSSPSGNLLSFEVISRDGEETVFLAKVCTNSFSGTVEAATFVSGQPTLMFDEMAANWKGWNGEKRWQSIDGSLTLKATSDLCGHIQLSVSMENFFDHLSVTLHLEAGQLEAISRQVQSVFA
ncbi:hypothetical protein EGT07_10985 [Herbaspirillum sp. HC18]|nr:hypothetical protein EGT07_10985 [Herbaspirillum sp. HC18]